MQDSLNPEQINTPIETKLTKNLGDKCVGWNPSRWYSAYCKSTHFIADIFSMFWIVRLLQVCLDAWIYLFNYPMKCRLLIKCFERVLYHELSWNHSVCLIAGNQLTDYTVSDYPHHLASPQMPLTAFPCCEVEHYMETSTLFTAQLTA